MAERDAARAASLGLKPDLLLVWRSGVNPRQRERLRTLGVPVYESESTSVEQIADTLEALEGDINEKAVNVAAFTRNLDASAQAIREAGKAMLARADRIEKRAESIRAYLLFQCQAAGIQKIESPMFTLAVRKNPPAVDVFEESQVPPEYFVQPPAPPPRLDRETPCRKRRVPCQRA